MQTPAPPSSARAHHISNLAAAEALNREESVRTRLTAHGLSRLESSTNIANTHAAMAMDLTMSPERNISSGDAIVMDLTLSEDVPERNNSSRYRIGRKSRSVTFITDDDASAAANNSTSSVASITMASSTDIESAPPVHHAAVEPFYHACGVYGCILEERHSGLCVMPPTSSSGRVRSRTAFLARADAMAEEPEPSAERVPLVGTDSTHSLDPSMPEMGDDLVVSFAGGTWRGKVVGVDSHAEESATRGPMYHIVYPAKGTMYSGYLDEAARWRYAASSHKSVPRDKPLLPERTGTRERKSVEHFVPGPASTTRSDRESAVGTAAGVVSTPAGVVSTAAGVSTAAAGMSSVYDSRADCGACVDCLDKPKFGGRGIRYRPCMMRPSKKPRSGPSNWHTWPRYTNSGSKRSAPSGHGLNLPPALLPRTEERDEAGETDPAEAMMPPPEGMAEALAATFAEVSPEAGVNFLFSVAERMFPEEMAMAAPEEAVDVAADGAADVAADVAAEPAAAEPRAAAEPETAESMPEVEATVEPSADPVAELMARQAAGAAIIDDELEPDDVDDEPDDVEDGPDSDEDDESGPDEAVRVDAAVPGESAAALAARPPCRCSFDLNWCWGPCEAGDDCWHADTGPSDW